MRYWVFTVTTHKDNGETYEAAGIYTQRMKDEFWGLGEKTPNRKSLQKGDAVVFYVGYPEKVFVGSALLASACFKLDDAQRKRFGHGRRFYSPEYGVLLNDITTWERPRPVSDLVSDLSFIENKEFWFAYFQGGIRQVSQSDYQLITTGGTASLAQRIAVAKDLESESEFALEAHLEEFIAENWERIGWQRRLKLFVREDQSGRQYPAGQWSIDFLAVDESTNDLVVIELKRGKTSDAVVGQLLRYMSWVKENLAEGCQRVRGIIVAHEMDDALKYAVSALDNVEVFSYRVNFRLVRLGDPSKK